MKRNYTIIPLSLLLLIAMVACSNKSKGTTDSEEKQPGSTVSVPQFDADSAYRYVKAQVDLAYPIPRRIKPAGSISQRSWNSSAPRYTTSKRI